MGVSAGVSAGSSCRWSQELWRDYYRVACCPHGTQERLKVRALWGAGTVPCLGPGALWQVCPSRHGEAAGILGLASVCSHGLSPLSANLEGAPGPTPPCL